MPVNSRAKGKRAELDWVKWWEECSGKPCSRNYDQAADGGNDVNTDLPFSIEIKVGLEPRIWPALHQAKAAAQPGEYPLVGVTRNMKKGREREDVVVMYRDDFGELLKMLTTEGIL